MLSQKQQMRLKYEQTIDTLGVPARIERVSGDEYECVIGWRTSTDEELINAFGVGVKVATIKERDVPVVQKMDRIRVLDDRYTVDEVFPVYLNDLLIGWRCVIRGK